MIEIRCPRCRESERLEARRERGLPRITCLACGHAWTRDEHTCPSCGERQLKPSRVPLIQKARGTQQSIIGYRIAKRCASCGWESEQAEEPPAS